MELLLHPCSAMGQRAITPTTPHWRNEGPLAPPSRERRKRRCAEEGLDSERLGVGKLEVFMGTFEAERRGAQWAGRRNDSMKSRNGAAQTRALSDRRRRDESVERQGLQRRHAPGGAAVREIVQARL